MLDVQANVIAISSVHIRLFVILLLASVFVDLMLVSFDEHFGFCEVEDSLYQMLTSFLQLGGLHCDRCKPGYWGLHMISEGINGCTRKFWVYFYLGSFWFEIYWIEY